MKTENITKSIVSVMGTATGAVSSRIVADSTPIKNAKLKHGVIAGVAIIGAAFLDRKTAVSAFTQDVAIGVSAAQIGYLVKELVGETAGTLKTALGSPDTQFLASHNSYDFIPFEPMQDASFEEFPREIKFR